MTSPLWKAETVGVPDAHPADPSKPRSRPRASLVPQQVNGVQRDKAVEQLALARATAGLRSATADTQADTLNPLAASASMDAFRGAGAVRAASSGVARSANSSAQRIAAPASSGIAGTAAGLRKDTSPATAATHGAGHRAAADTADLVLGGEKTSVLFSPKHAGATHGDSSLEAAAAGGARTSGRKAVVLASSAQHSTPAVSASGGVLRTLLTADEPPAEIITPAASRRSSARGSIVASQLDWRHASGRSVVLASSDGDAGAAARAPRVSRVSVVNPLLDNSAGALAEQHGKRTFGALRRSGGMSMGSLPTKQ